MTNAEAILDTLRLMGPLTREELAAHVEASFGIPAVITATCLYGLQSRGKIVLAGDLVSLPRNHE